MAYPEILEDIKKCIALDVPGKVPIFGISMDFDIKYCGINRVEYGRNLEKIVESSIKVVREFDYDWILLHPDDYIEFEGIIKTKESEKFPARPAEYIKPTLENIKKLKIPNFRKDFRMPIYLEALSKIKEVMGDNICLTGRLAAPFSSAALIFGISETMMLTIEGTDILKRALDFFIKLQIEWGIEQIKSGADAIWIGDCVASSQFISPGIYEMFAAEGAKIVSEEIKRIGGIAYFHAAESSEHHLKIMSDLGFDIINIGEGIDIKEAKRIIGDKVCISGNLAPIKVLENGTVENIKKETKRIMIDGKENGGFIFNTEEGISDQTPEENLRMMIETAKKYRYYNN
jgi:uroporphyrinogen decarboxylase